MIFITLNKPQDQPFYEMSDHVYKVAIADDQTLVRKGICRLVNAQANYEVVLEVIVDFQFFSFAKLDWLDFEGPVTENEIFFRFSL